MGTVNLWAETGLSVAYKLPKYCERSTGRDQEQPLGLCLQSGYFVPHLEAARAFPAIFLRA